MTMLYMDSFDHYGTKIGGNGPGFSNMLDGAWASVGGAGAQLTAPSFGARTGPNAYSSGPNSDGARYVLPGTENIVFVSMGFAVDSLPSTNNINQIIKFGDNANAEICTLTVESTGAISVRKGGTVIAATQGPVIVASNWHYLEMKINRSGGTFTLRVDDDDGTGTPAITASSLSLGSNNVAQVTLVSTNSQFGTTAWVDDFMIRNASGSINNDFFGDRRVATLLADDDTATAGWSPNRYYIVSPGILNLTNNFFGTQACLGAATSTSLDIGAGDFTLESFTRFEALPSGSLRANIFSRWDETNNKRSYQLFLGSVSLNGGSLCWQTSTDGTSGTVSQPIVYPWTPDLDTWYHIAMVRASGELLLFVNGEQFGLPIADSSTYFAGSSPFGIGGQTQGAPNSSVANTTLQGWLDETRFTNGFARYTTNFTPPTAPFPRGSGGDANWSDVVLLAGYDGAIVDESGFARTLTTIGNASDQIVTDTPPPVWPTIGKLVPDDSTFIEAPFIAASSILTFANQPTANQTVTVGTKNGSTAAVYTFKASVASAFDVLIDTSVQATLQNLYNAINAGTGAGTKYGTGTTSNFDVSASQLPAGQMAVTANDAGTSGNSIASTTTVSGAAWTGSTLAGGVDIPGPSNFKVQRLPANTTLISAVQISMRSFKSDAGIGTINSAFVGPLGTVDTAPTHSLTVSPVYYNDVFEEDPDTSGPISPTTIINGSIQINRDT